MSRIFRVYKAIDDADISVYRYKIPFDCPAATIEIDGDYGIFIDYDKIDSVDDEFIVLAHEYGHCATGTTHSIGSDSCLKAKHEYKANRKSILTFLPSELLKDAFGHGCQTAFEVAEYLDLPEKFVIMAIGHYRCMGMID